MTDPLSPEHPLTDAEAELALSADNLVRVIARTVPLGEWDDRIQAGWIGAMKAARTFRPELGYSWWTHARIRIRGEMLDQHRRRLRPLDGRTRWPTPTVELLEKDVVADEPTPEDQVVADHHARWLLEQLDEAERELLTARLRMRQRHLAAELGLTEGRLSQRWRIYRPRIQRRLSA